MNNQFLELINNPALNTDNTIRYSLMYQVKKEDLSHHITEVSLLSYFIALKLNENGENLDIGSILERVLLHDLDEVLTGDIPRSTKYYNPEGLHAMKMVAEDAIKKLSDRLDGAEEIVEKWRTAKEGKEGMILVLSDMLCVARKVVTEVKLLGNGYFLKVAYEMLDNLAEVAQKDFSEFSPTSQEYIRGLIHDATEVMSNLVTGDDRLERYGVINNVFAKH